MCPLVDMVCNMLEDRLELNEVVYKDQNNVRKQ